MKFEELRAIEGRNIYSHYPVLRMLVRLDEVGEMPTKEYPGFNERLLAILPGLHLHSCSRGYAGGFVERLHEGTYPAHVLEHIIIELMDQVEIARRYGKTRRSLQPGCWLIVTEFRSAYGALACARLGLRVLEQLIAGEVPHVMPELLKLMEELSEMELGPSTAAIAKAAEARKITVRRLNDASLLQLGTGSRQRLVQATLSDGSSSIAVEIAGDKALTKKLLEEHSLPVPEGIVAHNEAELLSGVTKLGWPLVLKPLDSNQGKGVSLNLNSREELMQAWQRALAFSDAAVLERQVSGKNYRFLVVGDKLVAAAERQPAHVVGNGSQTVAELVGEANLDSRRGLGHEKALTRLPLDEIALTVLARQGFTSECVPAAGQEVWLREAANLSSGGSARDCTGEVHPQLAQEAVRAAQVIGLEIAGVDLVLQRLDAPLTADNGAIIEINAAPGIRMHLAPSEGDTQPAGEAIIEHLFPQGKPSEIPIIAVTGTNGKTTTSRLLAFALRKRYAYVGLACSDGIYRNDLCLERGDNSGPRSARMVLGDKLVDFAVLETARGGLIRGGLGYDLADIAIVTNISNDHLGQDEIETLEELINAKALVVEAVRKSGHVVLNADDEATAYLLGQARGEIIFFSLRGNNALVRKHRRQGGRAVFWRAGTLWLALGELEEPVSKATRIPIAFQGRARHNLANAAAGAAALWAHNLEVEEIREALETFTPTLEHNPGRQNLFACGDFSVMFDYGHNQAGFQQMMAMARGLKPKRLVGVLTMPGDRLDQDIIEVGAIASGFDHVCFREDADLRGRASGMVASLLYQGWQGKGQGTSHEILSEREAVCECVRQAQSGDLILIFYESLELALQALQEGLSLREPQSELLAAVGANASS